MLKLTETKQTSLTSTEEVRVQVQLLHEDAKVPTYATYGSAGCDIYAVEDFVLPPTTVKAKMKEDVFDRSAEALTRVLTRIQKDKESYIGTHARDLMTVLKKAIEETHYEFNIGRVHTESGVAFGIPIGSNIELELRGRSGLAFRTDIHSFNGTLDEDYKLQLNVLMYNLGNTPMHFKKGDKICQGVFKQILQPILEVVEEINQEVYPSASLRENNEAILKVTRQGGLGHTGKN